MKTEKQLRNAQSPWPKTEKALLKYIKSMADAKDHDYGTCVYAMSLSAVATFNYVAHKLGCTGFQASCADLDIIRRTRSIKGPFAIIKAEQALYPQYNVPLQVAEYLREWQSWLKTEAEKQLKAYPDAHPDVIAHWKKLAAYEKEATT